MVIRRNNTYQYLAKIRVFIGLRSVRSEAAYVNLLHLHLSSGLTILMSSVVVLYAVSSIWVINTCWFLMVLLIRHIISSATSVVHLGRGPLGDIASLQCIATIKLKIQYKVPENAPEAVSDSKIFLGEYAPRPP